MVRELPCASLVEIVDKVGVDQIAGGMVGPVGPLEATHIL